MTQMLEPDEFFARFGRPDTWEPMSCGGVIGPTTTREELIARGFTPGAADEVLSYRNKLAESAPVAESAPREEAPTWQAPTFKAPGDSRPRMPGWSSGTPGNP